MYYLYFDTNYSLEEKSSAAVDFSWWKDLVRIQLNRADYFEIRLWKEETNHQALAFCQAYAAYEEEDSYQKIYSGMIDENLKEELLKIAIGEEGLPIFFSLWLYRDGEQILASDHYGMEFVLSGYDQHSVVQAAEEIEQIYGIDGIQIYMDEKDEQEVQEKTTSMTDEEIRLLIEAFKEEGEDLLQ